YRYALVNLNPFAVVGANDLYDSFNLNGELDIFDPVTGDGQLSAMYLADRAEMLVNLIYCNIHDTTDAGGDGSPVLYTDIRAGAENLSISAGNRQLLLDQARYTFGSNESDPLIPGTSNNDHLFGMGGNDTLDGKGGDDWLEGGVGDDTLYGGEGADTYFYNPGSGQDTITDTENSDADTNHITVGDLDLVNTAIESYYSNTSQTLYTFIDSTNGLTYEWNPLTETVLITGSLLDWATTGDTNSISINDIDNPNQLLERFGINLTFCLEAALTLDTTNPFTLQNYIADDLSATLAEWGSLSFSLGVNQALSSGDKIVIQVSGSIDSSVLALVYKGQQLDFVNGEITIDIIEGQSLFAFALLQQGELVADASAAITATLITVDDDGNEMDYDILNALNISVKDNNFITGTAAAPVTTRDIVGDMSPVDADPDQEGMQYSYDDLGNVVTDDNSETRDDILYDSSANDTIISGEGDDTVYLNRGGEDVVELGEGDDWLLVESEYSERIIADGSDGRDYLDGGQNGDVLTGGSSADLLHGNSGDDLLFGDHEGDCENFILNGATEEASGVKGDLMDAADGNDQIFTGAGNDFIAAGSGDDLIVTGGGDDFIRGDQNIHSPDWKNWGLTSNITTDANGSTTYTYTYSNLAVEDGSGSGNDTVYAGAGNDTVFGENGDDTIFLEAGDDISWGGAGTDIVLGGAGDDMINGDNGVAQLPEALHGDDFLDGGIGNDKLYGMGGSDILFGGAGDDNLYGDSSEQQSGGNDYLNGEEGNDTLIGAAGNDTLVGGSGNDLLLGLEDNDVLMGGTGDDELQGGDGNDYLWGEEDTDILFGGDGEDVLSGGAGGDELQGGVGNDQLYGDDGDDLLFGMEDDDSLYGGTGDDQLVGFHPETPDF
ncbi:MAG: calcium-binding protein, partial [Desulfuromonas thiophila]|nr:calcium-binding protein [Desulfuromonas thiophila]